MPISKRSLFLAGLLMAGACSDAGTPVTAGGREPPQPLPGAETMLMAVDCTVDELAGTMSCEPVGPRTGGVLAAVDIGSPFMQLVMTNYVPTAISATMDIAIKNMMNGQVMGTTDGVTAHSYGMRVFFWDPVNPTLPNPRVLSKVNAADTAWVTVTTPDSAVFAGTMPAGVKRPYFQHAPEILNTGQSSTPKTWTFARYNVATWTYRAYVSAEVLYPRGWLDVTPTAPTVPLGTSGTLAAAVRSTYGQVLRENLNWTSSDPAVATVTELSPVDTLAQVTGVSQGTAWIKAVSASTDPLNTLARRDSVLVTVN